MLTQRAPGVAKKCRKCSPDYSSPHGPWDRSWKNARGMPDKRSQGHSWSNVRMAAARFDQWSALGRHWPTSGQHGSNLAASIDKILRTALIEVCGRCWEIALKMPLSMFRAFFEHLSNFFHTTCPAECNLASSLLHFLAMRGARRQLFFCTVRAGGLPGGRIPQRRTRCEKNGWTT